MFALKVGFIILYYLILFVCAVYGIHRFFLLCLYYKYKRVNVKPKGSFPILPNVTIQLPIFNEMYVVERLLDATSTIDYPKEKMEIQVLDDSTDETSIILKKKVDELRRKGYSVTYIHRDDRKGYKAGALDEGFKKATGEFTAIFDADFVPQKDFLQKTIHYFTDESVGMIQLRWEHMNRNYSLLTRLQSIFIDGHFVIDQAARSRSGRFFNFNGTAGIWRKSCIERAGGWQHDTLTEDLDLSYRAQLDGWRFVYLPDVVTPGELPVEMNSFKSQQHRWAKGSIQTARKLLPKLWRSPIPLKIKLEATLHLTNNLAYMLLIALSILMLPVTLIRFDLGMGWYKLLIIDLPLFIAATLTVTVFFICSQKEICKNWIERALFIPLAIALSIGLCVNNAQAVLEGMFNNDTEFLRTPKYRIETLRDTWKEKKYKGSRGAFPIIEMSLGIYFTITIIVAIIKKNYMTIPFLIPFQFGFLYVSSMSILQEYRVWPLFNKDKL